MIDNEVILVNLEKGYYYSLLGTAVEIWSGITAGISLNTIISELSTCYTQSTKDIAEAVQGFLAELIQEEILKPCQQAPISEKSGQWHMQKKGGMQFSSPVMERYVDLEELLLLDPVHDVDEMGWPKPKPPEDK